MVLLNTAPDPLAPARRKAMWRQAVELILPLLLIAGLLSPDDDAWRPFVEAALLPLSVYYVWTYGLGGRLGRIALSVPLVWIVWLGLSSGWGVPEARRVWHHESMAAVQTALFFILCVTYFRVTPRAQLDRAGIALVLASAIALVVSGAQHFSVHPLTLDYRISGIGLFANANRAAALSSLMALFAMHLSGGTANRALRVLLLCYVPLSFAYVILTGSRGGLLVYLATLAAYVLLAHGRGGVRHLVFFALVAAALVGVALVIVPDLHESAAANLSRSAYRSEIWQEAWRLSKERWVLGHGLGYDEPILGQFKHAHDLHLSNLLYGGVPALVLGMLALAAGVTAAISLPSGRLRALAGAGMVLILTWSLPNGGVPISKPTDDWYHFWLPMSLAIGMALRAHAKRSMAD